MIADALTKRHGNSVTSLKFLKRSTLGIQDEVKELANLRQFQQEHGRNPPTNRQHEDEAAEAVEWSRRLAVGCSKSIPIDPDLEAESLATLDNPEIEIRRDCDVAVVWNPIFDRDSRPLSNPATHQSDNENN